MDLRSELAALLGDERRVSVGGSELEQHAGDLSHHRPHLPDAVVYPEGTAEVAAVLAWANERRVPVTAFGAATSLEGHVIPVAGGISLDLTRLDRILELLPDDYLAVVQPSVASAPGSTGNQRPCGPAARFSCSRVTPG